MEDKKINAAVKACFDAYYNNETKKTIKKWSSFVEFLEAQIPQESCFSHPHTIFIEVTSQCNLRCKHCFYSKNEELFSTKEDLTTREILRLLKFLTEELGIINFVIIGREPLLNKDIFKIIKYLKSKNVYLKLQTNATLFTDKIIGKLGKILNPKTDFIQISLDGATEKIHDQIRGKGAFKKTTEAIKKLSTNNINVIVAYTVNSLNVNDLPSLYELGTELRIKQLMIGRFEDYNGERDFLIPDKNDVVVRLAELTEKNNKTQIFSLNQSVLKIFDFLDFTEGRTLLDKYIMIKEIPVTLNPKCHRDGYFTVFANGDVCLCPNIMTDSKEFCLGNLKKQTFYEIWGNRSNNLFFQNRCYEKSICGKCKYLKLCHAGCPATAFFKYGTTSAPSMHCNYAEELSEKEKWRYKK